MISRVRWVITEMVKESLGQGRGADEVCADLRKAIHEEAMLHVIHAYAAYRTPFHRSLALKVPSRPRTRRLLKWDQQTPLKSSY